MLLRSSRVWKGGGRVKYKRKVFWESAYLGFFPKQLGCMGSSQFLQVECLHPGPRIGSQWLVAGGWFYNKTDACVTIPVAGSIKPMVFSTIAVAGSIKPMLFFTMFRTDTVKQLFFATFSDGYCKTNCFLILFSDGYCKSNGFLILLLTDTVKPMVF